MSRYKLKDFVPVIIIPGWHRSRDVERQSAPHFGGAPFAVFENMSGLRVIMTLELGVWLHVSVSRPNREPSWYELTSVKKLFMGNRFAIQILPPEEHYLNLHQHCLHLWARVDDEPIIPDELWKDPDKP
jgi:hypothetical protein